MSANTRPIIGINCDFYATSKTITAHARVNAGYFDAVVKAGGLPLLLPPLNDEELLEALLDKVDGVLLTGGLDIDPRRQGQPGHPALQPMAERRETNDRILLKQIFDRQLPVLGIGLGMQQLNAYSGGTLHLHIPTDCPKSMPHFDPTGAPHRHIVLLEPESRIEEIYGDEELRVNSRHHQCVNTVGPNMRIAARCPDGVIEAIEWIDPSWFCIGVQWHPEADTASALDMQIFECFVQATVRESPRLQLAA
jgi:putative glutamine amidotransferase